MQKMTKKELQNELYNLGESAPEKWSKMELKARISELREESGLPDVGAKAKTPLQLQLQELNKMSRKKETLRQYVEKELQVTLTGHETTPQIQTKAIRHLYKSVPASAGDYVGFGQHADLQYVDMLDYPKYTNWLLKTNEEESEADPRLRRLASWLAANKDKPRREAESSAAAGSDYRREHVKEMDAPRGYRKVTDDSVPKEMVQALMQTIEDLKGEVAELKGERPRKTRDSTEDKDL